MSIGTPADRISVQTYGRRDTMDDLNSIIRYESNDYGTVKVKLAELLDAKGITRNRLRTLTGVKYDVIDRYYRGSNITMVDIDFLAKVCFVLNCDISDLLEYQKPD